MAKKAPSFPLSTDWPKHVKMGILHVIALAFLHLRCTKSRERF